MCMYIHIYTYHGTCVDVRESLWELGLTLHHVDSGRQTQAASLRGKHHHILSSLTTHTSKGFFKIRTETQSPFKGDFDTSNL